MVLSYHVVYSILKALVYGLQGIPVSAVAIKLLCGVLCILAIRSTIHIVGCCMKHNTLFKVD